MVFVGDRVALVAWSSGDRLVRTTCPRDCYDACGVLVAVRDGEVRHVRGDPDHHVSRGRLCAKCSIAYNGVLRDNDVRLTRPLRRAGPKGSGQFEPVSWAGGARRDRSQVGRDRSTGHGPATILNAHYTGTCALLGTAFPLRFFHRLGATEIDPDTICNKAGYEALSYLYGDSGDGFDPETASEAGCILVWGANPSASAPHQHEHWLAEAPGTVVVVDPVRTPTAAAADLHLQPFRARTRRWPSRSHTFCSATVLWIATSSTPTRSASTSSSRCSSRARRDGRSRRRACRQR